MDITGATRAPLKEIKNVSEDMWEQASEMGQRLGRGANDAYRQSKRALGRFQESAEDTLEETRHNIRRRPFESVALAVAAGAALGVVIGYALGSRRR